MITKRTQGINPTNEEEEEEIKSYINKLMSRKEKDALTAMTILKAAPRATLKEMAKQMNKTTSQMDYILKFVLDNFEMRAFFEEKPTKKARQHDR